MPKPIDKSFYKGCFAYDLPFKFRKGYLRAVIKRVGIGQ